MAARESRLFNILSYAICGSDENSEGAENEDTLTNIHNVCFELMQRDYTCEILKNSNGCLCGTYPANLIIPVQPNGGNKVDKLKEHIMKGRLARTRGRFVVPVLLVNNKYACRSSTLARSPEIYCRRSYGYWMQGEAFDIDSNGILERNNISKSSNGEELDSKLRSDKELSYSDGLLSTPSGVDQTPIFDKSSEESRGKEWLLDKIRSADITLLQYLGVDTIFDLMVEKKKVKFGMNVTSSEKVDRQQRYLRFNILSVPYPGCEFFTEYRNRNYHAEGLKFNWKQNFVDANLHVPENVHYLANITWNDYVKWDLVEITQNYLKLHLHSLIDENSTGILLHCISGWDRTPLFVSLMRLSLWADGLVHQSLDAEEMVYFTVAYDWLLFSHQFNARISNGEEIFYFCFDFLKYIYSEEYSMLPHYSKKKKVMTTGIQPQMKEANGLKEPGATQEIIDQFDGEPNVVSDNFVAETIASYTESESLAHTTDDTVATMDVNGAGCWDRKNQSRISGVEFAIESTGHHCTSTDVTECDTREKKLMAQEMHDPKWRTSESQNFDGESGAHATSSELSGENGDITYAKSEFTPNIAQTETIRERKLRSARELLIPAYHAVIQSHQERHRENNSGFAATLFSQLTKTLNLVKR